MNRILQTALLMLTAVTSTSALADVKTVPYVSNMSIDGQIDPDWTTIDVDKDATLNYGTLRGAWSAMTSSTYLDKIKPHTDGMMYYYHSTNPGNDWLVSPYIHLEAGIEYKLRLTAVSNSQAEAFRINMSEGNTEDALSSGITLIDEPEFKTSSSQVHEAKVFTVETSGDYAFGIYSYSLANRWWILVTDFQVVENVFAPAAPTGLTVKAGTDDNTRALSATISWTNPTTDADGVAFSETQTVESVNVYRDDELLTTLSGNIETYTDDSATLTAGYHTYSVEVTVSGSKSARVSANSPYIGPLQAQTLPYHDSFNDEDSFNLMWTAIKGDNANTTAEWEYNSATVYGKRISFRVSYSDRPSDGSDIVEDEWLISPPVAIPAPGTYKIGVRASVNEKSSYYGAPLLQLFAGSSCSVTGMTELLEDNLPLEATQPATEPMEYTFTADAAGEYYFGLHAASVYEQSKYGRYYYIYGIDVESMEEVPAQVTNLSASVDNPATRTIVLTWTNPTTTAGGSNLTQDYKIEIYRNNELIHTLTNTLDSQTSTYTDVPETSGVFTYTLKTTNLNGISTGTPVSVTAPWVGVSDILPGIAENLTVAPAADKSLSATVSWTNPTTTNVEGATTDLTKAVVYRNSEQIGTVTENLVCGEISSFVDETVPEAGIYTYSVEIFNVNGKSDDAAPTVESPWIGPGLPLPYTETDFSSWTVYNLNNDYLVVGDENEEDGSYSEPRTWLLGTNGLTIYSANSTTGTDDWAVSPRFEFAANEIYTINVTSYVGYGNQTDYQWDIAISPDGNPENMTTIATITTDAVYKYEAQTDVIKIATVDPSKPETQNDENGTTVSVPAGTGTIGFHARNLGGLTVTGFSITGTTLGLDLNETTSDPAIKVTGNELRFNGTAEQVKVFDIAGMEVISSGSCTRLDISGLCPGIYIASAIIEGRHVTAKFSK